MATIDDKVKAKDIHDKVALDLGFKPDKYYTAKDKMALQLKEDGRKMWAIHMTL